MTTISIIENMVRKQDKIEHCTPTAVGGVQHGAMASITMATSVPARSEAKELGRGRGCAWTLYEYDGYLQSLKQYAEKECSYAVWGYEVCPKTNRPHLQGYVHWSGPRSLGAFSSKFGNCHVEKPIGTPKQNREYCLKIRPGDKPNERFEEYGVLPVQGHRTDWDSAVQQLKNGVDVTDIIEQQPQLLPCQRALREFKNLLLKPVERDVEVIVLYGAGGVGKTRWARDNYPGLYKKPASEWWDGYTGQKAVLLDDFYGWIKYHDILTILDRYAVNLPFKGGYVWAQYDTVIITSNLHPRYWYKNQWNWPLRRRLKKIIKVSSIDGEMSYEEEDFPATEKAWRIEEEAYADA